MNILKLEYWSDPPLDLDDDMYCQISTRRGVESGWYFRDLTRGKRKGWKEVYVLVLGTDDSGSGVWRWRKRIVNPGNFKFQPRFPIRPSRIVREEQGLYWCHDFNTWKRIDGDI